MWFEKITGFKEVNPDQVRNNLILDGEKITSKVNGKTYNCGTLEIVGLKELRAKFTSLDLGEKISVKEVVADVQQLHTENENALFQAASQFNLLEMVGPHVVPEEGIGIYQYDKTQGPACAIACGAGTIYRSYFVAVGDQIGQTQNKQIDCLSELAAFFQNEESNHWEMKNGYVLASEAGLKAISKRINELDANEYEALKGKLKIGLQLNTEVTISQGKKRVSQIYCSALPVRYSPIEAKEWEAFARLVLDATYEATLYAGLSNYLETGNNKVFLTLVGGGAFGNSLDWILEALEKAILKFGNTPLDLRIVSYGNSEPRLREICD